MAIFAHGSQVHIGNEDGPPETFSQVPAIGDIEFTPPQPERIDVTNHDSAAREYLQGLGGEGEVTFDVHFDAGEPLHITLRDQHGVADTRTFQIHFPDVEATVAQFEATVSNTFSLPVGDAQVMSCTLAISGAVTWP